ncbi:MAG TPA: ABC transporter substrate-binding protein [Stellaceae bacterium]
MDRKIIRQLSRRALVAMAAVGLVVFAASSVRADTVVRVGHFPNITHAQGLVAHALTRQGKGWFEQRLGPGVGIEWYVYGAGPAAMEAMIAKSIDLTYVGPNPALNVYAKSGGTEARVISGAAEGGSGLVVQPGEDLKTAADFRGKKIATPQLGNTQDVAARSWLIAGGLHITQTGGDAQVIPTANPDQLLLFRQKQLDGVWTVEPWISQLVSGAGGQVLIDEPKALTTLLVARADFLDKQRDLVKKFVAAQQELTDWIDTHPDEAQQLVRSELKAETQVDMAPDLVAKAWGRIHWTHDVRREQIDEVVKSAQAVGFLRDVPDLGKFVQSP